MIAARAAAPCCAAAVAGKESPMTPMQPMTPRQPLCRGKHAALALAAALTIAFSSSAPAVDTVTSKDAPDLTSVRAKIKAKDYRAALAELKILADTHQHADVYSLMGFSLRKSGDYQTALTFYNKALDFDADHKGAREYLGELYVETGDLGKARAQLAVLARLCPQGCEEREDLEKALAAAAPKTN
jgi:Flp pilus assembly protein TadD